jgi:hypothetical protein
MAWRSGRAQQIEASIRSVLLHDWDPFGARGKAKRRDAYDSCIGAIYSLLVSGAAIQDVTKRLIRIEEEEMGLGPADRARAHRAAHKLCSLDLSLDRGGEVGPAH